MYYKHVLTINWALSNVTKTKKSKIQRLCETTVPESADAACESRYISVHVKKSVRKRERKSVSISVLLNLKNKHKNALALKKNNKNKELSLRLL